MKEDPFEVLSVFPDATEDEVREAWLDAVKHHPPDRDPEGFRRLREAYDQLRDPEVRLRVRLFGRPDLRSLPDLGRLFDTKRRRVGYGPWRDALREGGR